MNGSKVTLPNGKIATYHGTSSSGYVYVSGRRVYGRAAYDHSISGSPAIFTPKAGSKWAYLVNPIVVPDDASELASA